jgi:signal transduction histidine kinase
MTEKEMQRDYPLVLVVDDDDTIRLLMRESLEHVGFAVEEAEDGVQALSAFERVRPDIVLLDVMMPRMDGFATCATLRTLPGGAHTPVLMVTRLNDIESIDRAYEAGATDFITKPLNWTILSHRVRYMLRASQVLGALQKSEAKNRALLQAVPDLIFHLSKDGTYLDFKPAKDLEPLVAPHKFLGKRPSEVLPSEVARQSMSSIEQALQTGNTQIVEYQLPQGDAMHDFEARVVACGEEEVLAIVRDITERKRIAMELLQAKEAAEAADRTKSEFLATMSHELRTPLTVILGYTDLIIEETFGALTSEEIDILQRIRRNGHELLDLITAVLDLSRLEAGRLPVEVSKVQVSQLLKEIERETQELQAQSSLTFAWKAEDNLPYLFTDPGKLKIIIKNLINNAIKFTQKGCVVIDAHASGSGVTIRVTDTGIGIPAEALPIIFEPFRQFTSTTTRQYGGTGLGLHIVRRLLELLGGTITVESEVGQGSTFQVWVPIDKADTSRNC